MPKPRPARGFVVFAGADRAMAFRAFKWTVYALLAANVWLYSQHGRLTELLDTAAWFVLLMLFEWETGEWRVPRAARLGIHGLRAIASVAIAAACVGYALEAEWLDFANELTWLVVVLLLELELRVPPRRRGFHFMRRVLASVCYAALLGFLLCWLGGGLADDEPLHAFLDAWDALLWLVAFGAIELNVVRTLRSPLPAIV